MAYNKEQFQALIYRTLRDISQYSPQAVDLLLGTAAQESQFGTYQGHELEDMVLPFQMRMRMEDLDPKEWERCKIKWSVLFASDKNPLYNVPNLWVLKKIDEGRLLLRYDEWLCKYNNGKALQCELELDYKATHQKFKRGNNLPDGVVVYEER